jgi:hypothetical protein
MEQQAGSGFALHVAATKNIAEILLGGRIDDFSRCGKLSWFEDAKYDTRCALLFRAAAFYAKFQIALLDGRGELEDIVLFQPDFLRSLIIPQVFAKSQSRSTLK